MSDIPRKRKAPPARIGMLGAQSVDNPGLHAILGQMQANIQDLQDQLNALRITPAPTDVDAPDIEKDQQPGYTNLQSYDGVGGRPAGGKTGGKTGITWAQLHSMLVEQTNYSWSHFHQHGIDLSVRYAAIYLCKDLDQLTTLTPPLPAFATTTGPREYRLWFHAGQRGTVPSPRDWQELNPDVIARETTPPPGSVPYYEERKQLRNYYHYDWDLRHYYIPQLFFYGASSVDYRVQPYIAGNMFHISRLYLIKTAPALYPLREEPYPHIGDQLYSTQTNMWYDAYDLGSGRGFTWRMRSPYPVYVVWSKATLPDATVGAQAYVRSTGRWYEAICKDPPIRDSPDLPCEYSWVCRSHMSE